MLGRVLVKHGVVEPAKNKGKRLKVCYTHILGTTLSGLRLTCVAYGYWPVLNVSQRRTGGTFSQPKQTQVLPGRFDSPIRVRGAYAMSFLNVEHDMRWHCILQVLPVKLNWSVLKQLRVHCASDLTQIK